MSHKSWTVYLLVCADGTYYCGISNDLPRRLNQHNGMLPGGAKYTAPRRPARLLGQIECADKSAALRLEAAVRKLRRPAKLAFFSKGPHAGA